MFCSISGEIAEEPVVSVKSGHIFEKKLIEKQLAITGRCPVTDQILEPSDLLPVKVSKVVKPRPTNTTSIPALLQTFQNEWDALMLETYNLRQQLDTVRKELATTLYRHDAACRVIARLVKERDEARSALANYQPTNGNSTSSSKADDTSMQVEPASLPKAVKDKIQEKASVLFKERKSRQLSPTLATSEEIKHYDVLSSHNYHKSSPAGVTSLSLDPNNPHLILTGGNDGNAILFNTTTAKIHTKLLADSASTSHSKPVTRTAVLPHTPAVLSASLDATLKLWSLPEPGRAELRYAPTHPSPLVDLAVQSTGDFVAAVGQQGTWTLHDLQAGAVLCAQPADPEAPATMLSSGMFHPDGLLLGLGEDNATRVSIWDIKAMKVAARFSSEQQAGHVTCLNFSENGYYLAVGYQTVEPGASSVAIWDLRKQKPVYQFALPDQFGVRAVSFDYSGNFLAAAGAQGIQLYFGKTFSHLCTLDKHSNAVTAVQWGPDAKSIFSASLDRFVKVWGNK